MKNKITVLGFFAAVAFAFVCLRLLVLSVVVVAVALEVSVVDFRFVPAIDKQIKNFLK